MRILISAYACEPDSGSEPEVGLQVALAAASQHDVWLITRENNIRRLEAFLERNPMSKRIRLIGVDLGRTLRRMKKSAGLSTLNLYYELWQRRLQEVALALDAECDFDVVHHATFSAYWSRVGVAVVDKPLVWGPVGGGVTPPLRLIPVMGLRGGLSDIARLTVRPAVARLSSARKIARKARVVLVQNHETARHLGVSARVLPNALIAASVPLEDRPKHERRLLASGRLIGLKAFSIVIRALAQLSDDTVTLHVYGDGPQQERLQTIARRLGVADRVCFLGHVPRDEMLAAVSEAAALVHPALHEEAGFVIAEALALGTPVVCLNRGGPPSVARFWSPTSTRLVTPTTPSATVRAFAQAVEEVLHAEPKPDPSPAKLFKDRLLEAYAEAASAS